MKEKMMENKYYTPDISEFHFGFEFESNYVLFQPYTKRFGDGTPDWYKHILTAGEHDWFWDSYKNDAYTTEFRVKYLDTDDIKELGWDVYQFNDRDFSARLVGKKYHVDMYYHYPDHTTQIVYYWPKEVREGYKIDPYNLYNSEYLFSGVVKNKSELKRILEMIKINYND